MKKIYNKFIKALLKFITFIDKSKTKIFELKAINRKKKFYSSVKWSKEQQIAFDAYWKKYYGKKIPNKWHKLYQSANGIFNVEYMPEVIFSTKIEQAFNDYYQIKVFADKNLNDVLFNNKIENVRTPKTYLFNSFGRFYDGERNLINKERAIEILASLSSAVIKPTIDSSSGRDVNILDMQSGINKKTGETAEQIINKYRINFIVQEKILPNEELKIIYPKSINTMRVITYLFDGKVYTCPISLRIGGNGSEVDNIHAGGMSIAVGDDGDLADCAYRLGYGDAFDKYYEHPDTKVKFSGYKLSFVNSVIKAAKKLHVNTNGVGLISWDFTVNNKNEIIVIEANYKGQSSWFPQMLSGKSLFGDNTSRILENLKRKNGL